MHPDAPQFFNRYAGLLPVYEALEQALCARWPDTGVRVQKSQIAFFDRHGYAWASLPVRRRRGWPERCLVVTFGGHSRVEDPRIAVATEPYPNRWTHHVLVTRPEDIDAQLLEWIRLSHDFSVSKR